MALHLPQCFLCYVSLGGICLGKRRRDTSPTEIVQAKTYGAIALSPSSRKKVMSVVTDLPFTPPSENSQLSPLNSFNIKWIKMVPF